MKLSEERLAEFNSRMNDWISKQGLLFQLTHGGTGLGGRPPIVGSIVRSLISIVVLLVVAVLGYGGFLFWKASGDELPKQFDKGIAAGLGLGAEDEIAALGFDRDMSSGSYKSLLTKGNDTSFFTGLEARGISFPMGLTSGLFGEWNVDTITIDSLSVGLKAGEADDERSSQSWQSLFHTRPDFNFTKIDAKEANFTWGYSAPATWGSLLNTKMHATRTSEGWTLQFRGGTFSQGIFRHFQVEEMTVMLDRTGGLKVPAALMSYDGGALTWSGEMTSGGASPEFAIRGELNNIPVHAFLPRGLLALANGNISGKLTASGSTNSSDGICYQIEARPEGAEGIHITKELPLLRMLSHLDPRRSYRKLPFNRGAFTIETKGDTIWFKEIELTSTEEESTQTFARLRGSFKASPTTAKELAEESTIFKAAAENATTGTIGASPEPEIGEDIGEKILNNFRLLQFSNPHRELLYMTKDDEDKELLRHRLELVNRRKFRFPFVLDGEVSLAVPKSAFEKVGPLPEVTEDPSDADLRWIRIPLRNIISRSTEDLSAAWEQAMEEAGQ